MSTRLPVRLAFVLTALASACASKPPVVVDEDRDMQLDTEDAWTGRVANYGEDFVLATGESVSFGAHAPVVRWAGDGAEGLMLDVILQRVPPDVMSGLKLVVGKTEAVAPCAITLVRREPADAPTATLNVTCR